MIPILLICLAGPPSPPGLVLPLYSPKDTEQRTSLIATAPLAPNLNVVPPGFRLTNIFAANGAVTLSWQEGIPAFQIQQSADLQTWANVGPQTYQSSITITSAGPFFRVMDSADIVDVSGVACENICARPDGLHGTIDRSGSFVAWHNQSDVHKVKLGGWAQPSYYYSLFRTCQFLGSSNFVVMNIKNPGDPVVVTVYDMAGNLVRSNAVGDANSRNPVSCRLADGSVVGISHQHIANTGSQIFDLLHVTTDGFWSQRFDLVPAYAAIASTQWSLVQGADGLIYGFYSRDSSHRIGKVVFAENGQSLSLVSYDPEFLTDVNEDGVPRDGLLSPNGEMPWVSAVRSDADILLCYENAPGYWDCYTDGGATIYANTVIARVSGQDKFVEGMIPGYAFRTSPTSIAMCGRVAYSIVWERFIPEICSFSNAQIVASDGTGTRHYAYFSPANWCVSDDGWVIWEEFETHLFKLP